MSEMRLQKFLAQSGVASRRKAEDLIRQGKVTVNGSVVTEMGIKISEADLVLVDGHRVTPEERKVYLMLNKPVGYVTTVKDQFGRPAVVDLLQDIEQRVYPVGRLDYDTSGLLILTNDGDFAYRLTHPKHRIDKVYMAEVKGIPDGNETAHFEKGLKIDDYVTSPAQMKVIRLKGNSSIVEIKIHEGKNRQVRKMCEAVGHPVINLKRIAIGTLKLGGLAEGQWRELNNKEVKLLLQEY